MDMMKKAAALTAATVIVCASLPAQAAGCWQAHDIAAAKVRDLQTMLMVAALRCRAGGIDVSADYNGFVSAEHDALAATNQQLKAHFSAAGNADAQTQYDRFATALANAFGGADTGGDSCAEAAATSREAATADSIDALVAIADRYALDPALPGAACNVTLAAVEP